MPDLSTIPQEVNIEHYAGDTLTVHLTVPTEVVAGRTYFAQVRAKRGASKIDASFQVIPNAGGADIMLLSADSMRLANRGPWSGFWDVQLAAPDGSDPVTTLAQGELVLVTDVTRAEA
jgi:hypothetical protein